MDFLSAKTLEGKLWVTFHIVKYGIKCGDGGGAFLVDGSRKRSHCAERQREKNKAELGSKKKKKERKNKQGKITEAVSWKL